VEVARRQGQAEGGGKLDKLRVRPEREKEGVGEREKAGRAGKRGGNSWSD
jgi:hypothetical protein